MNADGSTLRQVTSNAVDDEFPSWSPDGRKILFQRDFDPVRGQVDYDLFTMKTDGTGERNLTNSPGIQETDADWSRDGRRIAFDTDRDGTEETPFQVEIFTMRADGSNQVNQTRNPAVDLDPDWQAVQKSHH